MSRDAEVGEGRCANPRQLGELLEHAGVAVIGRIVLVEDRDHEPVRLALDQEAGVEVDGQRNPLPRERRGGDGRVERDGPDGQLQPERTQEVGAPVAGACDHALGLDHVRTAQPPT